MLGSDASTENPWGTSRHCPRCGEKGQTVKAPNDYSKQRHGGHFHCPDCGYKCDRDVVGAVNVGRKHLSESRMEAANPVEYISAGNHASFPSHSDECARSSSDPSGSVSGVQSTTNSQQDLASVRQTRLPQFRFTPLTVTRGGVATGGLHQNHSRKTASRQASGSVTMHVLATATGSTRILPNTTEN